MTGNTASWWILLAVTIIAAVWAARRSGVMAAMGAGMAVSLLAPTWVQFDFFGMSLTVRSATAVLFLIALCVHSGRWIFKAWGLIDWIMAALMLTHVVADSIAERFSVGVIPFAYSEWIIPFAAGRYAVLYRGSVAALTPWMVAVGSVLATLTLVESLWGINPWEVAFVAVDDLVTRVGGTRFGIFHRAIGPTRHPIFLAIVLMLVVPWCVTQTKIARSRRTQMLGWFSLVVVVAAIFATGSRGPMIGLLIAAAFAACVRWPLARIVIPVAAIAAGVVTVWNLDRIVQRLDRVGNDRAVSQIVQLDGKTEVYTGTNNRLFVWKIYAPLVVRGGPLGYGTAAVSSFPPQIPGIPALGKSRETLGVVDNSFLLIGLRLGWIGLMCFAALLVACIASGLILRRIGDTLIGDGGSVLAVSLAGMLVGVSAEILTVFFSYDFAFWILWHCGILSGLVAYCRVKVRGQMDSSDGRFAS